VADKLPDRPSEEHPIIAGLVALVGVGLVVGLVIGLVVLAGTKVLGIGGDDDGSSADEQASIYLPTPSKTSEATDPESSSPAPGDESPSEPESESESPEREITLSASTTEVGPMEQFQLTGVYPMGEGAILTVQRMQDGSWVDFPATGSVSGEAFQIAVQTSKSGVNRFRVVDTDSGLESGEVRVTVG
jgi:hypothetical protein